jgi:outer membrane receptor protein involved in Fe transport
MRLRTACAGLLAVLLLALPAAAQEQRGSIEGIVKDASGAILPGATVELKSTTGTTLNTVSDAGGVYRFPSLAPDVYNLSANLSGFGPGKVDNVRVGLGEIKKVDFALSIAGVAETVQVTAESPLVDVKQAARQTNIRAEQVALVPHGRDFTSLVTQAPGANNEAKLGGLSIDGASAGENRYIVDGIETTNLQSGLSGKNVIVDFIDEVQVKSSGYTAEYGGATGGVINAITKSGTNDYHGYTLLNWQGDKTSGGNVPAFGNVAGSGINTGAPTLRISLTDQNKAEYVNYKEDSYNRYEPGFAVGGPILKNKAWFFGAYQPAITPIDRTVTLRATGSAVNVHRKDTVQYITANQTSQLGEKFRTRVAYNNSWSRQAGLLPSLNGTDAVGTNYAKSSTFPNYSLSGNADWIVSPRLFVGARGGYYNADQYDTNVPVEPQFTFQSSNVGLADVPGNLQHPTGFLSVLSNSKVDRDQQTRAYFQADTTWYASLAGQHQFKFGLQYDRLGNNVLRGNARPVVRMFWNQALSSGSPVQRGNFGYYEVRSNGVDPSKGIITEGNVHSTNVGFFAQDSWTVGNRLTINAGLRTEREEVPAYTTGPDIPDFGIKFAFGDKLAPRAGFAYDVTGNGRTKVFGSWGIFYDIFKLELPRGSFGGDKWLSYYYSLEQADYTTLLNNSACPPACPGQLIRGPIDFRHPSFGSDAIEPNLRPMKSQEATVGLDHELNGVMAVSAHYVHKQLDRAVEDTGSLDADGNEIYIIANPSEGLTAEAYPGIAMPNPKRQYDGLELAFEKRLSNRWFLRTSYLLSRLYGNYSGLTQSDENGRTSPNVGRGYDYPIMMFTGDGQPAYGALATDRPHQAKAQFIYQLPIGISLGLNQYVASGVPVSREVAVLPTSNYPVQYAGRGSDGRTPMFSQTDFYVQHEFRLGTRAIQLNATVQNLFNEKTATSRFSTQLRSGNGLDFDQAAFYAGQINIPALINAASAGVTGTAPSYQDPRFLLSNDFQAPILARFGVKFIF